MESNIKNKKKKLKSSIILFKQGKFLEAETGFQEILKENQNDFTSLLYLGMIKLFSNQLENAKQLFLTALDLKPTKQVLNHLLGETFYRLKDFKKASQFHKAAGRKAVANKLASFNGNLPYQIEGEKNITFLKFKAINPLPVVQIQVNNSEPVNFFIDTGGAEFILDTQFAKEIGAESFGHEIGSFAGGKTASFSHGRVNDIVLGDYTLKNIPINMMDIRPISKIYFEGLRIDGAIGTIALYQFFASIDYLKDQLILRKKDAQSLSQFEKEMENNPHTIIPFWLAGDHYMVAWGKVNNSSPLLFFVDTGLAEGGFIGPKSTLQQGNIKLDKKAEGDYLGGGGNASAIPFVVEELSFGDTKENKIRGVYFKKFPVENMLGFHIGGLISHDYFKNYTLSIDFTKMRFFLTHK